METPAAYGLPGPEEELVYLVLLQLTREAAENAGTPRDWPQTVYFSRRDIIARLGWPPSGQSYESLAMAFNRLKSVSIEARYAFYNAETKAPAAHAVFGILDEAITVNEPQGRKSQRAIPLSNFTWSKSLHASFVAGNVRSLALDFAISLDHPTSRRLFRLLELLRYASKPPRPQLSIGLEKLRDRLGMAEYRYPSQIAQKLAPGIKELTERSYLAGMTTEKGATGEKMAIFRFGDVFRAANPDLDALPQPAPEKPVTALQSPAKALALPDFGPRTLDAALLPDQSAHNASLDAIFEALPDVERAAIEKRAIDELPPFLRDNLRTSGAQSSLSRTRRREVAARYPELKRATSD